MKGNDECHKKYESLKFSLDTIQATVIQTPRIKSELIETFTAMLHQHK